MIMVTDRRRSLPGRELRLGRSSGEDSGRSTGSLGPSERVVVPVLGTGGQVVALVSVGITVE
ncbi:hypothetical protein AB0E54_22420, partial [Amycolatopsis coloradensis]|uniref:hypothetical protein n=1 Tax=Amycolatopsis coloradensis TaxID=76021 RepID=UPI0033C87BA6